jgi:hypothetical protein
MEPMDKKSNPLPMDWIESTPEWKACFGLIDDTEYLQLTAHYALSGVRSPEHRAKIAAAQKRRWQKKREESGK